MRKILAAIGAVLAFLTVRQRFGRSLAELAVPP